MQVFGVKTRKEWVPVSGSHPYPFFVLLLHHPFRDPLVFTSWQSSVFTGRARRTRWEPHQKWHSCKVITVRSRSEPVEWVLRGKGRGAQHVICRQRGEHGLGPVCGLVLERFRFVGVYLSPKHVCITWGFDVGDIEITGSRIVST